MANIPEHIHALPRTNKDVVLPEAVMAWDANEQTLYIGDGETKGGVFFRSLSKHGGRQIVTNLDEKNQIHVSNDVIPVAIKTHKNTFYMIRGEDLSISADKTKIIIDISNALAVNNLSEFQGEWTVYFAKGDFGGKGDPGYTPIKGVDYGTEDDINVIMDLLKSYVDEKFSNGEW